MDKDIETALELYSQDRQPHTERLLRIVHNQITNDHSDTGNLDAEEKLLFRLQNRANTAWLSEHDAEAAFAATVAGFTGKQHVEKSVLSRSPQKAQDLSTQDSLRGSKL